MMAAKVENIEIKDCKFSAAGDSHSTLIDCGRDVTIENCEFRKSPAVSLFSRIRAWFWRRVKWGYYAARIHRFTAALRWKAKNIGSGLKRSVSNLFRVLP